MAIFLPAGNNETTSHQRVNELNRLIAVHSRILYENQRLMDIMINHMVDGRALSQELANLRESQRLLIEQMLPIQEDVSRLLDENERHEARASRA